METNRVIGLARDKVELHVGISQHAALAAVRSADNGQDTVDQFIEVVDQIDVEPLVARRAGDERLMAIQEDAGLFEGIRQRLMACHRGLQNAAEVWGSFGLAPSLPPVGHDRASGADPRSQLGSTASTAAGDSSGGGEKCLGTQAAAVATAAPPETNALLLSMARRGSLNVQPTRI